MTRPSQCIIDGCAKSANVPGTARGYCSTHYHRWQRTGDPLLRLTDLRPPVDPICKIEGCETAKWAQGYCPMHLMRVRTTGAAGDATRYAVRPSGLCVLPGCTRLAHNGIRGWCRAHYLRFIKYGDPLAGGTFHRIGEPCVFIGCEGTHYARGMCQRHWARSVGSGIRRTRLALAPGECTGEQIAARVAYFGGRCWICGEAGTEIDHVKPLSRGGSHWPSNLRPACKSCNSRKRSRWLGVGGLDHLRALVLGKVALHAVA